MATFEFPNADLPRVAVLLGGDSAERAVSLESGAAVVRALRERNYRVTPIDPAFVDLSSFGWSEFDVVFLALHGQNGEDGTVQELLESAEIPYTGSDAYSSRLAFSKSASKERFVQSRVPTPDYVLIHETDEIARVEQHAQRLGFPVVIKPDSQGRVFTLPGCSEYTVGVERARREVPAEGATQPERTRIPRVPVSSFYSDSVARFPQWPPPAPRSLPVSGRSLLLPGPRFLFGPSHPDSL